MNTLIDVPETIARWEAWWEGRNDRALMAATCQRPGPFWSDAVRPWMDNRNVGRWTAWMHEFVFGHAVELTHHSGDDRYLDEACALLERYYDSTQWFAEAYPFLHPTLGPACLPAFVTGYTKFAGDTIWLELEHPLELPAAIDLLQGGLHPFAEVAFDGFTRLTKGVQKRCIIAELDLGTGLDVLSALRGPQNLAYDIVDSPEAVRKALDLVANLWEQVKARYDAIILPGNHGATACVMRYLAGRPSHLAYCDFSAMISREMFAEFVQPYLSREAAAHPGRTVWHLDGPGQIRHVPAICSTPGVRAIQWVCGAGNPGSLHERWYPLYRQILDHGCRICLQGVGYVPAELTEFFRVFPAREFMVPVWTDRVDEARKMVALRDGGGDNTLRTCGD